MVEVKGRVVEPDDMALLRVDIQPLSVLLVQLGAVLVLGSVDLGDVSQYVIVRRLRCPCPGRDCDSSLVEAIALNQVLLGFQFLFFQQVGIQFMRRFVARRPSESGLFELDLEGLFLDLRL